MTKEQIKDIVRNQLSTKRIVLFGAGTVAEEFYLEHKDKMNITHCVSNIESEWGKQAFLGELDVCKYRKEDIEEGDYMVVCGPFAFRTIELQLYADGWMMYENFVESNIATAVFSGKKIALFYGQCVLRDIYKCIVQVPAFTEEYSSVFTQTNKGQSVVINRLLYHMKDICDLYVYTPKVLDRDSIYSLGEDDLNDECKVISISNVVVSLYWPEVEMDSTIYNEWYLHPYNTPRDLDFYHTLYRRADLNINKMVLNGDTTGKIIEVLSDDNFYSEKEAIRNVRLALRSVDIAERQIDVTIGDYIKENYAKKMLFQNSVHATKFIIWEYVRRLLAKLEVSEEEVLTLEQQSPMHIHEGGDVPIYPSVAKSLNLEFANESYQYGVITGSGIQYMTFREYMEHYIEYTRKAMKIKMMW